MKKICQLILAVCVIAIASPVFPQSTAQQVLPGYLGTKGCTGSNSICYQFSTAPVRSSTGEASHVLKNAAGTLFGFSVTSGASAGYVLVYNAVSAPADGAVTPVACYALPANQTVGVAYTPIPLNMSTGITLVFSTTGCFTQTSSATAFFMGEVL